jgi:phage terminase large subunit
MPAATKTMRLHPAQAAFRASSKIYRGFVGGIGSGKSFAGAYDLIRRAKRNRLYMVVAPTYPMMRDASLRSFLSIARELEFLKGFNKAEMVARLGNDAEVIFRTADDPERLRGPNLSGVWMDEASLMTQDAFNIIIGRLREAGEQGWLSATFTPKGKSHWTFDVFGTGKENSEIFHARTDQNPFIIGSFHETLSGIYEGAFKSQELGGEFVDEDDSFLVIPPLWVKAAVDLKIEGNGPIIGGLDIAEEGNDDTVLYYRAGPLTLGMSTWNKCNTTITAHRAAHECRRLGVKTLNYDADGVGTGPKGIWQQSEDALGFVPVAISSGSTPSALYWPDGRTSADIFHNRRAEMWWLMRCRFERTYEFVALGIPNAASDLISIPNDARLIRELSGPKLEYTDRGKIKIESKDKMRARGVKSPDRADALVYAFVPVFNWEIGGSRVEESLVGRMAASVFPEAGGRRGGNGERRDSGRDGKPSVSSGDFGGGEDDVTDYMSMRF